VKKSSIEATNELDRFFESPLPLEGQGILDWWCEKRTTEEFPTLSIVARRLFSIPGSAAILMLLEHVLIAGFFSFSD
jgi:hypothetical protein